MKTATKKKSTKRKDGRSPGVAALIFLAAILVVANLLLLATRRPAGVLHPRERENDAFRLAGLTARTHISSDAPGALQVTYAVRDRCGSPLGLAVLGQITRDNRRTSPETQLWFSLSAGVRAPRDPSEMLRDVVVAVRDPLASDLVPDGEGNALFLELSDQGIPAVADAPALRIDNLVGPHASPSAAAHRPSLGRMVQGLHCRFTLEDLRTFELLTRILRARVCDDLRITGSPCYDTALTIFRNLHLDTYRLDLRTLGEPHGLLHLSLELERDPSGKPTAAVYRLLPHTSLEKTANLFFTHPRPADELLLAEDPGFTALRYLPPITPEQQLEQRVDLKSLLGRTAWLEGP